MKQKGMSIEQVVNAIEIAIHKLPHMETLYTGQRSGGEDATHSTTIGK
jgi:hypothetical protein